MCQRYSEMEVYEVRKVMGDTQLRSKRRLAFPGIVLFLVVLAGYLFFVPDVSAQQYPVDSDKYRNYPDAVSADLYLKYGYEQILDYHSEIWISTTGKLDVVETIKVVALSRDIRHGIYRDFPTVYRNSIGLTEKVGFEVIAVKKDGADEPYSLESVSNGTRIYIGNERILIDPGVYTYSIQYRTDEQLGFFRDHDELFYNITGNGWVFPINDSSASIYLPEGVDSSMITVGGYTGPQGSRESDIEYSTRQIDGRTVVDIASTVPLSSYEGLTVYVEWPKGYVEGPGFIDKTVDLLIDNIATEVAVFWALVVLAYYIFIWVRYGLDPKGKAIYPRYEISPELSPARARYIKKMTYDIKSITAALVDMAVKGCITIVEKKELFSKQYSVDKKECNTDRLSEDERVLYDRMFKIVDSYTFMQSRYQETKFILDRFKANIEKNFGSMYVLHNTKYTGIGVVVSLLGIGIVALMALVTGSVDEATTIFGLVFWVFMASVMVWSIFISVKDKISTGINPGCAIVSGCGVVIGIAVGIVVMMGVLSESGAFITIYQVIAILFLIAVHFLFYEAIKARTPAGRTLYEEVAGLEMFIKATEEEKLKIAGKEFPKTISTYEKYLPYAIAFDLEHEWSKQFAKEIEEALADPNYHHGWYIGPSFAASGFTSGLSSSMSSSISAAAAPPGSSGGGGGGGGGGGSGGGGGGGGGGGW
jgi:uncharacterized membrane protein